MLVKRHHADQSSRAFLDGCSTEVDRAMTEFGRDAEYD
jgi:hypothetical protein